MRGKTVLLLCLFAGLSSATTVITNSPAWDGTDTLSQWGDSDGPDSPTPTYGQTITVPNTDTELTSFTFYLDNANVSPGTGFIAYVQAWNGSTVTGSPVYSSAVTSTDTGGSGFVAFTFSPDVNLTAGAQYLLYFSTLGISFTTPFADDWGATVGDTYAGGAAWYSVECQGGDSATCSVSGLDSAAWYNAGMNGADDLAFSATFQSPASQAPEPSTFWVLAPALAAIVGRLFHNSAASAAGRA